MPGILSGAPFGGAIIGGMAAFVPPSVWSPAQLPTPLAQLDAAAIGGKSVGDALAIWTDLSGTSNDAAQATGSQQPTYQVVSGIPVARFDGADDSMIFASRIAPANLYIAMVIRSLASGGSQLLLSTYEGYDGGFAFGAEGNGTSLKCFSGYPFNDHPYPPNAFTSGAFTLVECIHDGTTKSLYVNGTLLGSDVCALTYGSNPGYRTMLGCGDYLGGSFQFFGGDIAYAFVGGAVPTVPMLAHHRAYLAANKGVVLTGSDGGI